ncbi:WD40-repeat-containing domain protein [Mycotypha africana]|uniref:WD40-repeat-containing domain protein n=1 Tax=Mycotypha africana TaxID=64632 RepID=UPI002301D1E0|nr:WD40-repeat-containing domain protein [Mycotypha africana]KAI8977480.1 WD40-repeat-containing domain protein [Mycotypha africana]
MSVYNHRPMIPTNQSRLLELLDAVKAEYDQLTQDVQVTKSQRDEYEHKVNSQIQEMNIFQQTLMDLERTQQMIKKQYEEEIARLRQQLDQMQQHGYQPQPQDMKQQSGGPAPPPQASNGAPPPPPNLHSTGSPLINGPPPFGTPPTQQPQQQHSLPLPPPSQSSSLQQPMNNTNAGNNNSNNTSANNKQPPPPPPPSAQQPVAAISNVGLNDLDPDNVPNNMKIEGQDWFALFNPKVPRYLKIDLIHTLEHDSVVCCVKFSLDGRYLAVGCNQATYIYDTFNSARVAVLQDETAGRDGDLYIRSVSFSPDGKYLATGAEDRRIRIWDIAKARIRCVLSGHEQDIYSLDFSRDGRILVSGSGDRTTKIWDWADAKCMHTLRINEAEQSDPGVTSIAISPDSRLVAAGSLDKIIRIWDAVNGTLLERLEGHKDSVYSVAFMPDGKTLVSGSLDKTLRLWQLGTKNPCIQVFTGHKDFVLSVATTPDDRWIISGSKDRSVQFWDPRTGQTQFMLQGHKNSVISVATSPGRRPLFATGSGDNRARIWSYEPTPPS